MQQVEFWALEHNQIDKKQIKKIKQPKSKNAKSWENKHQELSLIMEQNKYLE